MLFPFICLRTSPRRTPSKSSPLYYIVKLHYITALVDLHCCSRALKFSFLQIKFQATSMSRSRGLITLRKFCVRILSYSKSFLEGGKRRAPGVSREIPLETCLSHGISPFVQLIHEQVQSTKICNVIALGNRIFSMSSFLPSLGGGGSIWELWRF